MPPGAHHAPPTLLIALLTASGVAVLPFVGLVVLTVNGWALARPWHHVGWHLLSATCLDINVVVTVVAAPCPAVRPERTLVGSAPTVYLITASDETVKPGQEVTR